MNKKNISFVITFIIMFIISINGVDAISCSYGSRTGDDASTWTKQIKFEIADWNDIKVNLPESPILVFNGKYLYGAKECSSSESCTFKGTWEKTWTGGDEARIYVSLYTTKDIYELNNKQCPKAIQYRYQSETGWDSIIHHYLFFNDELDQQKLDRDWIGWLNNYKESGYFILESMKDKPLEELVDPYSCATYYNYLVTLEKDRDNTGSCDNNAKFNKHYQKLQDLCNNYRATSMYAKTDGDKVKATACNKACSMLKDDIAEMCHAKPSGGYCGSLGNKIVNWIFKIVRIVRYVIPILLILLSILDYIKAIAADSEDEMKKASGRFAKRLIVSALIFLVPFILDFLLRIFDIPGLNSSNPFCAK